MTIEFISTSDSATKPWIGDRGPAGCVLLLDARRSGVDQILQKPVPVTAAQWLRRERRPRVPP